MTYSKNPKPVCRFCGRPGKPAMCQFCGRIKCEGCTKPLAGGRDCQACRLGVWTVFGGKRLRLMVGDNYGLLSLCGGVAKATPVFVEYNVPEAVEEAAALKYRLERKGYISVSTKENLGNGKGT